MLTFIIVLLVAAAVATFVLTKKGKIADANQNNIPDVVEAKVEKATQVVEAEVKKVVEKVKKPAAKTPAKTAAKKIVKKSK